jgi:hypothetical protein
LLAATLAVMAIVIALAAMDGMTNPAALATLAALVPCAAYANPGVTDDHDGIVAVPLKVRAPQNKDSRSAHYDTGHAKARAPGKSLAARRSSGAACLGQWAVVTTKLAVPLDVISVTPEP